METQPDFRELLALFNAHHVEYLIVGGYALGIDPVVPDRRGAIITRSHMDLQVEAHGERGAVKGTTQVRGRRRNAYGDAILTSGFSIARFRLQI